MPNPLTQAELFLVNAVFYFYTLAVMLRLLLQIFRADFYNPISQLTIQLTNLPLKYLRRFIPGYAGIDFASVVLLLVIDVIKIILLCLIVAHVFPLSGGLFVWATGDLLALLSDVFFYSLLILTIISWVNPMMRSPVTDILYTLTEPLLRPIRRIMPVIGGFDLSPIPALILLQLFLLTVAYPLVNIGKALIFGG